MRQKVSTEDAGAVRDFNTDDSGGMFGKILNAKKQPVHFDGKGGCGWRFKSAKEFIKDFKARKGHKHFDTKTGNVDEIFGGLPKGLTIFVGAAGTGKSYLAKAISMRHKTLYVCAEAKEDIPEGENVIVGDYTQYLPLWQTALAELLKAIEVLKPDLVVIDSGSRFFSSNKKAIEESDLRPAMFELARHVEKKVPVIAISEVRGSGQFMYPAGGQGINHAAHLLIWFNQFSVRTRWDAERLGCQEGSVVWTIEIKKDKRGVAKAGAEYKIRYEELGGLPVPILEKAVPEVMKLNGTE